MVHRRLLDLLPRRIHGRMRLWRKTVGGGCVAEAEAVGWWLWLWCFGCHCCCRLRVGRWASLLRAVGGF